MSFAKLSTATRLRDVVTSIVKRTLAAERPVDAYGLTLSVDYVARKASVALAGSTSGVTVSFGTIQPLVGNIVRISGPPQDRYVAEVILAPPQIEIAGLIFGGIDILGGWTSFTPVLLQSVTVTKTVTLAKYVKIGRLVIVAYYLSATSAGTAGQIITVSLPFTAASPVGKIIGVGYVYDASAGVNYVGLAANNSSTTLALVEANQPNNNYLGASTAPGSFAAALANTDGVLALAIYESAT